MSLPSSWKLSISRNTTPPSKSTNTKTCWFTHFFVAEMINVFCHRTVTADLSYNSTLNISKCNISLDWNTSHYSLKKATCQFWRQISWTSRKNLKSPTVYIMPICSALILTPNTEAIFILLLERTHTESQLKKKKAVKLLIFMNVICVEMSLGNERYSKT